MVFNHIHLSIYEDEVDEVTKDNLKPIENYKKKKKEIKQLVKDDSRAEQINDIGLVRSIAYIHNHTDRYNQKY